MTRFSVRCARRASNREDYVWCTCHQSTSLHSVCLFYGTMMMACVGSSFPERLAGVAWCTLEVCAPAPWPGTLTGASAPQCLSASCPTRSSAADRAGSALTQHPLNVPPLGLAMDCMWNVLDKLPASFRSAETASITGALHCVARSQKVVSSNAPGQALTNREQNLESSGGGATSA